MSASWDDLTAVEEATERMISTAYEEYVETFVEDAGEPLKSWEEFEAFHRSLMSDEPADAEQLSTPERVSTLKQAIAEQAVAEQAVVEDADAGWEL